MSPKLLNILLILVPAVLYFGYLNPMYTGKPGFIWTPPQSIFALKIENKQYDNALAQVALIENGANGLLKDYKAISPEVMQKTNILLPDSIDPLKLRNEVLAIANKTGIAILGLKVDRDAKVNDPALGSYLVSFSVRAHYDTLKTLLEAYERNMRLYLPENLSIVRTVDEKKDVANVSQFEDPESLSTFISYRVYFLR